MSFTTSRRFLFSRILFLKPILLLFVLHVVGSHKNIMIHALSTTNNNNNNSITPGQTTTRNVATQVLQGCGPPMVDMNRYNLPTLDDIENEWTAALVQKSTESSAIAKLGAKNDREIFTDIITVDFPRKKDAGLGIELIELAGGREDGLGITVITGLVPGGSAEGSDILPGDSIIEVSLVRKRKKGNKNNNVIQEEEEEWTVRTECLCYDATVESILSLPPPSPQNNENNNNVLVVEDFFRLKLKRLRRRPKVTVKLQYPPDDDDEEQNESSSDEIKLELFAGENLRQGMLVRGVKLNDPLAKRFDTKSGGNCGAGGLCRTCCVSVLFGKELLNPQRLAESQMLSDQPRWRLACKAIVGYGMKEGTMTIRVNPNRW